MSNLRKCLNWIHLSLLWILFFFMSYKTETEHLVNSSIIAFGKPGVEHFSSTFTQL